MTIATLDLVVVGLGGLLIVALLYGCYRLGRAIKHTAEARASYERAAEAYFEATDRLDVTAGIHPDERFYKPHARPRLELVRSRDA